MFSVIMPTYNHAEWLRGSVESVWNQTWTDWELVLVDDGSTDETPRILRELSAADERIVTLRQDNAGAPAASDRGIACARGRWLARLDSDDQWFPGTLQAYVDFLSAHPEARFIYGYRYRLEPDGRVIRRRGAFQDGPTGTANLLQRMYLHNMGVCYERELYYRAGGFDSSLRCAEDYDLALRISLLVDLHPIDQPVGLHRRHDRNISAMTGETRCTQAAIVERFAENHPEVAEQYAETIRRRLAKLYYAAGRQFLKQGRHPASRWAFQQARQYGASLKGQLASAIASLLARGDVDEPNCVHLPPPPESRPVP